MPVLGKLRLYLLWKLSQVLIKAYNIKMLNLRLGWLPMALGSKKATLFTYPSHQLNALLQVGLFNKVAYY